MRSHTDLQATWQSPSPLPVKLLFSLICLTALAGCTGKEESFGQEDLTIESAAVTRKDIGRRVALGDISTVCFDGVQYWVSTGRSQPSLAPRFDSETKQVRTCTTESIPDSSAPAPASK